MWNWSRHSLPLAGVAGAMGAAGLLISVWLGLDHPRQLWHSYLVSWLFYLSLALGCLFFVLLQFACRAVWSVTARRMAEQMVGTLPLLALLFLPLLANLEQLYGWVRPEAVDPDPLLQHKLPYLNPKFFALRSLLYLLSWSALGWYFRRQSMLQDQSGDPAITRRLQAASGPGLVWFGVTVTLAAFDWIMSLQYRWYSTLFGVYFFSGCVVAMLALLIVTLWLLQGRRLLSGVLTTEHFHDLGKLLFGFLCFWAYIAFSQFLLIWYANLPEETVWYARRMQPGWMPVTVLLAAGHFLLPFFLLLPRGVKRNPRALAAAAAWVLLMHYLDLYWLVAPALHETEPHPHLLDATAFLALGSFFLAGLAFLMRAPTPTFPPTS